MIFTWPNISLPSKSARSQLIYFGETFVKHPLSGMDHSNVYSCLILVKVASHQPVTGIWTRFRQIQSIFYWLAVGDLSTGYHFLSNLANVHLSPSHFSSGQAWLCWKQKIVTKLHNKQDAEKIASDDLSKKNIITALNYWSYFHVKILYIWS